jgi:phenylacetate-coenzyme A ligase PaaK-like adenylate-forming protein
MGIVMENQKQQLHSLLASVWQRSAFYREYYSSHGIRETDLADLTTLDLPLLTKQTLMEYFDTAVTEPRLRKQDLEQWIQEDCAPPHDFLRHFIAFSSSGSSGHIGIFVYDRPSWHVMNSTLAPRLLMPVHGPAGKTKVAFYMGSNRNFGGVATAMQMPEALYDVVVLSLLDAPERVREQLHAFQPHRLTGYTSCVATLAEWTLAGKLRLRPQWDVVSGEPLTEGMKRTIQEAWGAPIYNLYCASESLYIAVQAPDQEEMTVIDELNIQRDRPLASAGIGGVRCPCDMAAGRGSVFAYRGG